MTFDQCNQNPADLNLGCPQDAARDAHYGAYLLGQKDWPLVEGIGEFPAFYQVAP
jgi:tRNA-dihydrouridine synthase 1